MDQREFLRQMEELVDFGRTKENLLISPNKKLPIIAVTGI